jgi:hypothetical protein
MTERPLDDAVVDAECLRRVRAICTAFAGADEGLLQDRPLFRIGRRRFAIFNGVTSPPRPRWNSSGRSIHFLADPLEHEALAEDHRFERSPHHGNSGWMSLRVACTDSVDWAEVAELLETAYVQVAPRALS